jgi:hypothetical protein
LFANYDTLANERRQIGESEETGEQESIKSKTDQDSKSIFVPNPRVFLRDTQLVAL